jgi:hypothetical protein
MTDPTRSPKIEESPTKIILSSSKSIPKKWNRKETCKRKQPDYKNGNRRTSSGKPLFAHYRQSCSL